MSCQFQMAAEGKTSRKPALTDCFDHLGAAQISQLFGAVWVGSVKWVLSFFSENRLNWGSCIAGPETRTMSLKTLKSSTRLGVTAEFVDNYLWVFHKKWTHSHYTDIWSTSNTKMRHCWVQVALVRVPYCYCSHDSTGTGTYMTTQRFEACLSDSMGSQLGGKLHWSLLQLLYSLWLMLKTQM